MDTLLWLQESPHSPLHALLGQARKLAQSTGAVLLEGETGSGKEVLAKYIHECGARKHGPWIAVNCGALPSTLLEATLFGALKGAFTGATQESKGLVRAAQGGTLFLDEVGELPWDAQSRLLRVLQERRVTPVGGHQEHAVDFRLLSATHRDLGAMVRSGQFREDLYYRLRLFPLRIPPLRERPQDIKALARMLWQRVEDFGPQSRSALENHELELLSSYGWPGNVRQLRNVLERYSLLRGEGVDLGSLWEDSHGSEPAVEQKQRKHRTYRPRHELVQNEELWEAMRRCGGNKSQAARILQISRGRLCYQVRKVGTNGGAGIPMFAA